MEVDELTCVCGWYFEIPAALSNHRRACRRTKAQLSVLLSKANKLWAKKQKKKKTEELATSSASRIIANEMQPQLPSTSANHNLNDTIGTSGENVPTNVGINQDTQDLSSDLSLAVRRPRRTIRKPGRFDDMVPHSELGGDDELEINSELMEPPTPREPDTPPDEEDAVTPVPSHLPTVCSLKDKFGVFHQYFSVLHLKNNPDRALTIRDISEVEEDLVEEALDEECLDTEGSPQHAESNASTLIGRYGPYLNKSSFLLAEWYWGGSKQKSRRDFRDLLEIIVDPGFNPNDIRKTPWSSIDKFLGSLDHGKIGVDLDAGWLQEEIEILVPFHRFQAVTGSVLYSVGRFFRRSIISIIQETLAGPDGKHFHFDPFDVYWQPEIGDHPNRSPVRIYGELYNSLAFAEEYRLLQESAPEPGCSLPRSIVALMFSSDETFLTQFGENTLWPLYMYFGNLSKYLRRKPNSHHCHHVAYFISLPDDFDQFVRAQTGKGPVDSLSSFCGREALHTQWKSVLDDEFLDAYAHGLVVDCLDGITRRLYPRIFTLSADYQEKVSLAGIRHLGTHPCPRCLMKLKDVDQMGTEEDRQYRSQNPRRDDEAYHDAISKARKQIFIEKYAVKGAVDVHLDPLSLQANENAFSARLSQYGFDVFKASVVDILHDVEQGSWKAVFIHLIRILNCEDKTQLLELDARYRQVPSFGRDVIRKFRKNTSEMKGLAARDFEDMLQCSLPVFEGLLPEPHNSRVLKLLFVFAHWHGLAKLRLHTDVTLELLDQVTTELGAAMREFQSETCRVYETQELEKEKEAREKRERAEKARAEKANAEKANAEKANAEKDKAESARDGKPKAKKRKTKCLDIRASNDEPPAAEVTVSNSSSHTTTVDILEERNKSSKVDSEGKSETAAKQKEFNLQTYKFHALGDYVESICLYGTTDSYSTELVCANLPIVSTIYIGLLLNNGVQGESEHRQSKARYLRTNKKNYIQQLTETERREARIRRIREENLRDYSEEDLSTLKKDSVNGTSASERYHISQTQSRTLNIFDLLRTHHGHGDPAMKNFLQELKVHLLPRAYEAFGLEQHLFEGDGSPPDLPISIFFQHDRLYEHKVLRLNYTTYDLRRAQDFVNPATSQCNIMVLSSDNEQAHPYGYARIMRIFHVNVICTAENTSPDPIRMNVLWVRWYHHHTPSNDYRLDELSFVPMNQEGAFGFIDPHDAIRSCHVIPMFAKGRKYEADTRGLSSFADDKNDWNTYYINRFVDRDMLMRHHTGFGVGHTITKSRNDAVSRVQSQPSHGSMLRNQNADERLGVGCRTSHNGSLTTNEILQIQRIYQDADVYTETSELENSA